jgi:pyruvate/2-oxoglutarate dehydrogenase complex dihydrolipoamide dehydrogenase (E3) component
MYDIVILGGGSGGLGVAKAAAKIGAKVALIEKTRGSAAACPASVPRMALVEAARLAHQTRGLHRFGLRCDAPRVDFAAVRARIGELAREFAASGSVEALQSAGIDVYQGVAAFQSYDTVILDGETRLSGRRFVIATGSRPAHPTIHGLSEAGFFDATTIWNLAESPESLIVLGSSLPGIELAQAFARLGSKVVMFSETDQLLPAEDPEVSAMLRSALEAEGILFHFGVGITGVETRDGRKLVKGRTLSAGTLVEVEGSHILVASGRLANVEALNLETVGVHGDAEHGIEVNDQLQTSAPNIYALGDVLGQEYSTHAAEREAAVVFQNAVLHLSKKVNHGTIPRVLFTDPEIAAVGLTESEAKARNAEPQILRRDYSELERARIDGAINGLAKVVASSSGRVLGATIVGRRAALVLQQFVMAMDHGISLSSLAETAQSHPTHAELVHALAAEFAAARLETGFVRTAFRWFLGLGGRDSAATAETHSGSSAAESHGHGH